MNSIRRDGNPEAVLDRTVLADLRVCDLRGELIPRWIRSFLAEAPGKLAKIEAALSGGDTDAAARLAHKLKSSAAWLGGRAFSNCCNRLEQAARGGFAQTCRSQLSAAQRALPALEHELTRYLAAKPGRTPPEAASFVLGEGTRFRNLPAGRHAPDVNATATNR